MQLLGYGEDALTLWMLMQCLGTFLKKLGDSSDPQRCLVWYRPSFGRSGGDRKPQFGEFDFIICSPSCLYLGENKWEGSQESTDGKTLDLRPEQKIRHLFFRFYVQQWIQCQCSTWIQFIRSSAVKQSLTEFNRQLHEEFGIRKTIPKPDTRLAKNLESILNAIKNYYQHVPPVKDILVFFCSPKSTQYLPVRSSGSFQIVLFDYSQASEGNFIRML